MLKSIIEIKVVLYMVRVDMFLLILCYITKPKFCLRQANLSKALTLFVLKQYSVAYHSYSRYRHLWRILI